MQPAPQVVVLAVGAAEEGAEIVEFDAAQTFRRAARAHGVGIFGGNPVDVDRIEFGHAFAAQQGQGHGVVERKAEVGEEDAAAQRHRHARQHGGDHRLGAAVGLAQLAICGKRGQHRCRLGEDPRGQGRKGLAQRGACLKIEIERQRRIDRLARILERGGIFRPVAGPVFGKLPGQQAQAADAVGKVMVAQEVDRRRRRSAARRGEVIEPASGQMLAQMRGDRAPGDRAQFGTGRPDGDRDVIDHPGDLDLSIAVVGITGALGGGLLCLVAPGRQAFHVRPVEEQGAAEQLLDRLFDLRPDGFDNRAQPRGFGRLAREQLEIVAHRLFARDRGQRAENHRKEAGRARIVALDAANPVGPGIDIDQPAVDFALRRLVAQRAHGVGKRRIDQHRAIDQRHRIDIAARGMFGHDAPGKHVAARPDFTAFAHQSVDLADLQRRKGAGKAGRGPRGKDQFGQGGKAGARCDRGRGAKADRQAMLAFLDQRRAVQSHGAGIALEVSGGDKQVERVARRQQRRAGLARGHGVERFGQQARKTRPAERRFEPARPDEARQLVAHFGPGFPGHAGRDGIALAGQQPAHQRRRPELGETRPWPRVGIEQNIDIGVIEPELRQRLQRLAGVDRLGEENPVDPAGACARDNVGQHSDPQPLAGLDHAQEPAVDRRSGTALGVSGEKSPARPRQLPDLLGHPVHIDRQADAAVADKRDAEFLLAHVGPNGRARRAALAPVAPAPLIGHERRTKSEPGEQWAWLTRSRR